MDNNPIKRKKTGGRTKGTPNKNTTKFKESLDNTGFNIAAEAVKLFQSSQDEHLKIKLLNFLANYSVAIPKPIEEKQEDEQSDLIAPELSEKTSEDLIKLIK